MNKVTENPAPAQGEAAIRSARAIVERILFLAFKHETQHWLDAPGTDAEKLRKIVGEARNAIETLDAASRVEG